MVAAGLWRLLSPRDGEGAPAAALTFASLSAWFLLGFVRRGDPLPHTFSQSLSPVVLANLFVAAVACAVAAFRAAGQSLRKGAAFGFSTGAVGICASRWPALTRAVEFNGGVFAGPFMSSLIGIAFAATILLLAIAVLWEEAAVYRLRLVFMLVALWAGATGATEFALSRGWGFGPRTLSEAAGVRTDESAPNAVIIRLTTRRGRSTTRETVRLASHFVDLSPSSLARLESFLEKVGYRDVFAREAMDLVRKGWLFNWDVERALDAMTLSVPGLIYPDYRGALDLIKVGPMTAERMARLERLAARAGQSSEGFEDVTKSQYIFEGFAAAYARFGDEAKARVWLGRIDNLMMVSEKKIEVAPLEDFREGRVGGVILRDGRPAASVLVGLFNVWRTTSTVPAALLLAGSMYPDENGRYLFADLGPGEYELALMARPEELRGRITGSPGRFTLGFEKPEFAAPAILIERDMLPMPQGFSPSRLPPAPAPKTAEPPLLWRKR